MECSSGNGVLDDDRFRPLYLRFSAAGGGRYRGVAEDQSDSLLGIRHSRLFSSDSVGPSAD